MKAMNYLLIFSVLLTIAGFLFMNFNSRENWNERYFNIGINIMLCGLVGVIFCFSFSE